MANPKLEAKEAELVEKLKSGDPDAVEHIYNANVDRIYSLVFNQVDRDHQAAQEIVQETFLAAVKSAKYFYGRSSILTWLCSIANRKVADFYRRKKREAKHRVDYAVEPEQLQDLDESAVSLAESAESNAAIRQALSSLPLHYRQVLVFKYIEGFSVSEISEIMVRSQKSIEGLLTRARKELQAKLATQSEG
jgi:RNA polymerase sigma-70 factor (ECF subfamily)